MNLFSKIKIQNFCRTHFPKHYGECAGGGELKKILAEKIPCEQEKIKKIRKEFGKYKIGEIVVDQIYTGMRGILGLIHETSLVDNEEGLRIRGLTIKQMEEKLPKAPQGTTPLPEAVFWLMLTNEIPTDEQVKSLSREWGERSEVPPYVFNALKQMGPDVHPMIQLVAATASLSHISKYREAYEKKVHKATLWEYLYEDAMDLIGKLNKICAFIYRFSFKKDDNPDLCVDPCWDWTFNYVHMATKKEDKEFAELLRLYLTIHSDHEGGNASAHTTSLVSSTLADPYLAYSAGMAALAGPLHGSANQEVLVWILHMLEELGEKDPPEEKIKEYVLKTLKSGRVVPGYGHAVLRKTDPRYFCQRDFAQKYLPDDPLFHVVTHLYKIVPPILLATGKVSNPWPNVDAHSGILLYHYGFKEMHYYTVLFGLSRALGMMASNIWNRALGFSIERPKSITTLDLTKKLCAAKSAAQNKKK